MNRVWWLLGATVVCGCVGLGGCGSHGRDGVVLGENRAPIISALLVDGAAYTAGTPLSLSVPHVFECKAGDPDGDSITYKWTGPGSRERAADTDETFTVTATSSQVTTVTCTVTDSNKATAVKSLVVTFGGVYLTVTLTPGSSTLAPGASTSLTAVAKDPDSAEVTYTFGIQGVGSLSAIDSAAGIATYTAPSSVSGIAAAVITVVATTSSRTAGAVRTITVSNSYS